MVTVELLEVTLQVNGNTQFLAVRLPKKNHWGDEDKMWHK